jgi:8-oxo-dGTP pyrophosphatase MutT (NUDIX family)
MAEKEIIDIFDEDGKVIGSISRDKAERDNLITENVLIFVFTKDGKVWAQLRPKTKNHYPGLWDISACGGIISGEKPDEAAVREAYEETGLKLKLRHVESFLNVFPGDHGEERRRLSHLYIAITDEDPKINEEVDEFKCWTIDVLKEDVDKYPEKYCPSFVFELDKALIAYSENK